MRTLLPQHSQKDPNQVSPPEVIEASRELMGGIDLDVASSSHANNIVRATHYYTRQGLTRHWWHYPGLTQRELDVLDLTTPEKRPSKVYNNPPGGCLRFNGLTWEVPPLNKNGKPGSGESSAAIWFDALVRRWLIGQVEQACFLGFTLEILRTTQKRHGAMRFPFCVPSERLRFLNPITLVSADQPTHSNAIVWLPPVIGDRTKMNRTLRASYSEMMALHFQDIGEVV